MHDFHLAWITEIRNVLNGGLLPPEYYAQAEQMIGPLGPDVLTLHRPDEATPALEPGKSGLAVASAPPRVRFRAEAEIGEYTSKRRTLVIRHASGDRIIALIEIVSPGNKAARFAMQTLVDKAVDALGRGYHLFIVDLFPPGRRDPEGIHGLVWSRITDEQYVQPKEEPLTLVSYLVGPRIVAYIEPTAVGRILADMPLFLDAEVYVNVPLEDTYDRAYRGVPRRWQRVLEGSRQ